MLQFNDIAYRLPREFLSLSYTWEMESRLQRDGLLLLLEGRTTIPAWQVSFDCSAVSVAAVI
jgi:hypothetical protein